MLEPCRHSGTHAHPRCTSAVVTIVTIVTGALGFRPSLSGWILLSASLAASRTASLRASRADTPPRGNLGVFLPPRGRREASRSHPASDAARHTPGTVHHNGRASRGQERRRSLSTGSLRPWRDVPLLPSAAACRSYRFGIVPRPATSTLSGLGSSAHEPRRSAVSLSFSARRFPPWLRVGIFEAVADATRD